MNRPAHPTPASTARPVPALPAEDTLLAQAARSQNDLRQVLELLGWADLPTRLVLAILDDLTAYALELKGEYATSCPFVHRRRQRVDHWVACWKEGLCSLEAAVLALQPMLGSSDGAS